MDERKKINRVKEILRRGEKQGFVSYKFGQYGEAFQDSKVIKVWNRPDKAEHELAHPEACGEVLCLPDTPEVRERLAGLFCSVYRFKYFDHTVLMDDPDFLPNQEDYFKEPEPDAEVENVFGLAAKIAFRRDARQDTKSTKERERIYEMMPGYFDFLALNNSYYKGVYVELDEWGMYVGDSDEVAQRAREVLSARLRWRFDLLVGKEVASATLETSNGIRLAQWEPAPPNMKEFYGNGLWHAYHPADFETIYRGE